MLLEEFIKWKSRVILYFVSVTSSKPYLFSFSEFSFLKMKQYFPKYSGLKITLLDPWSYKHLQFVVVSQKSWHNVKNTCSRKLLQSSIYTLIRKCKDILWLLFCLPSHSAQTQKNNTVSVLSSSLALQLRIINIYYPCSFNPVNYVNKLSKGKSILFGELPKNSNCMVNRNNTVFQLFVATKAKPNLKFHIVWLHCTKLLKNTFKLILPKN